MLAESGLLTSATFFETRQTTFHFTIHQLIAEVLRIVKGPGTSPQSVRRLLLPATSFGLRRSIADLDDPHVKIAKVWRATTARAKKS